MKVDVVCSYKMNWTSFSDCSTCVKVTMATRCRQFRWLPRRSRRSSRPLTPSRAESGSSCRRRIGWWRIRSSTHVGSDTKSTRPSEGGRRSTTASETTAPRSLTPPSSSRTGRPWVFVSCYNGRRRQVNRLPASCRSTQYKQHGRLCRLSTKSLVLNSTFFAMQCEPGLMRIHHNAFERHISVTQLVSVKVAWVWLKSLIVEESVASSAR